MKKHPQTKLRDIQENFFSTFRMKRVEELSQIKGDKKGNKCNVDWVLDYEKKL